MSYHLTKIQKGDLGQLSKIKEEIEEAIDAQSQGSSVMVLVELSDIIGSIECYLEENHSSIILEDLIKMARTTRRAFENGRRN